MEVDAMKLLTMFLFSLCCLLPAACAGPGSGAGRQAPAAPLEDTYWKLVEVDGKPVSFSDEKRQAHLIFAADGGKVAGSGGCNRLMGTYTVTQDKIAFGPTAMTHRGCREGMRTEAAFQRALGATETYTITGSILRFHAGDRVLAVFEAVP
jgi:heat shock protein HslJ